MTSQARNQADDRRESLGNYSLQRVCFIPDSPHVSGMARVLQARRGSEVTVQCHVTGDEPISVSWSRDGSPMAPFQDTKYAILCSPPRVPYPA